MYADMFGNETCNCHSSNSFNLNKNNIQAVAHEIAMLVRDTDGVFFNIQIKEEYSQYDVIMSKGYYNQGIHQRGIRNGDLIIGIIGSRCYGFTCNEKNYTSVGYYEEKLGIGSELLSTLFNIVRDELGGATKC